MDVQLVDVDNDWDLDFFGACRATNSGGNHYLMLNDGAGTFTDVVSLIPATIGQRLRGRGRRPRRRHATSTCSSVS